MLYGKCTVVAALFVLAFLGVVAWDASNMECSASELALIQGHGDECQNEKVCRQENVNCDGGIGCGGDCTGDGDGTNCGSVIYDSLKGWKCLAPDPPQPTSQCRTFDEAVVVNTRNDQCYCQSEECVIHGATEVANCHYYKQCETN